jgi:hypothetical protein
MLQKFKLHVTFIPNIFICYLLHNFFELKNKANIVRLLRIIEMEISPQEGQRHTLPSTIENIWNQSHVEGQKKFGDIIQT